MTLGTCAINQMLIIGKLILVICLIFNMLSVQYKGVILCIEDGNTEHL